MTVRACRWCPEFQRRLVRYLFGVTPISNYTRRIFWSRICHPRSWTCCRSLLLGRTHRISCSLWNRITTPHWFWTVCFRLSWLGLHPIIDRTFSSLQCQASWSQLRLSYLKDCLRVGLMYSKCLTLICWVSSLPLVLNSTIRTGHILVEIG